MNGRAAAARPGAEGGDAGGRGAAEAPRALDLRVAPGADGRSRLVGRRVSFPWSLGRAFPAEAPGAPLLILPQSAGAGLLAGDVQRQRLALERDARARLASAGATVVHGPGAGGAEAGGAEAGGAEAGGGGAEARADWRFELGARARLVSADEPYALLPGAALDLRTEIVIAPDAVFLGFEGVCPAGEGASAWRSELRASRPDGTPLFIDRQRAGAADLARTARLPGAPRAFGTLLVLAPEAEAARLRGALPEGPAELGEGVYAAVAALRAGAGLAARLAAVDGGALREAGRRLQERAAEALGMN